MEILISTQYLQLSGPEGYPGNAYFMKTPSNIFFKNLF